MNEWGSACTRITVETTHMLLANGNKTPAYCIPGCLAGCLPAWQLTVLILTHFFFELQIERICAGNLKHTHIDTHTQLALNFDSSLGFAFVSFSCNWAAGDIPNDFRLMIWLFPWTDGPHSALRWLSFIGYLHQQLLLHIARICSSDCLIHHANQIVAHTHNHCWRVINWSHWPGRLSSSNLWGPIVNNSNGTWASTAEPWPWLWPGLWLAVTLAVVKVIRKV